MSDLTEFYTALEAVGDELAASQPWWPCISCPVAKDLGNCCHKAMFHVTKTEWEYLREHPFIQENRERLVKNARRKVRGLAEAGNDTRNWSSTVTKFSYGMSFTCPLLDLSTGRCNVYERRPTICRTYGVSRSTEHDMVYGCSVVTQEVEAKGGEINFIPLDDVLGHLQTIAEGPTKPIVAWLAEEKI